jgi:hypothetical protein
MAGYKGTILPEQVAQGALLELGLHSETGGALDHSWQNMQFDL